MLDLVTSLVVPSISRLASRWFVVNEGFDGGRGDREGGIGVESHVGIGLGEPLDFRETVEVEKRCQQAGEEGEQREKGTERTDDALGPQALELGSSFSRCTRRQRW